MSSEGKRWNQFSLIMCAMAVFVDPLFFYIPVINERRKCLELDGTLLIPVSVLRTFFDLFYILHIIFQFRTGFVAPLSRVFGRGELIEDPWKIRKRYLFSYFFIDILSIIPLPQVIFLAGKTPFVAEGMLKYIVIGQYLSRLVRIGPLLLEVTNTSWKWIKRVPAFVGAAYMLASHVVGAIFYLLSIESELRCWGLVISKHIDIGIHADSYLACSGRPNASITTLLRNNCSYIDHDQIKDPSPTVFNFGIFFDALDSGVVESTTDFTHKVFYCLWWGMRNLSSVGQNLKTTAYIVEIGFAMLIANFGLFLFALLIWDMQKHLESINVRSEEMMVRRRDAERWMYHRKLPEELKERIRRYEQYKWQVNGGVEEEALICNFPKDLRRDIKRHICFPLIKSVPMFEKMDEQLLDAICSRLKPVLYTKKSYIAREGDPVDEMVFIMRGNLLTMTTNGGRTGFFNSFLLKAGDFCGEELLTLALDPNSSPNLPISTRTVETISEVEAFALMADDLKFFASQFRRLHSKQLRHTFRYYSVQWKTWAACFIQAAWRRYSKKKIDKSLREAEERLKDAVN